MRFLPGGKALRPRVPLAVLIPRVPHNLSKSQCECFHKRSELITFTFMSNNFCCYLLKGNSNNRNLARDNSKNGNLASEWEKLVSASEHCGSQPADLGSCLVHRDLQTKNYFKDVQIILTGKGGAQYGKVVT